MAYKYVLTTDREIKGFGLKRAGFEIADPALGRQLVDQGYAEKIALTAPRRKKDSAGEK